VLLSGKVRIYKASPDGKEYTLHMISPGQMFAEAAIFKGGTFPANCAAIEDSVVTFFPKDRFVALITKYPQISLKMISALSGFVRDFNQQVENLSLKEVSARLASYLLRMSEESGRNEFELETSKAELASSLGTISETLSRNLKYLRDLGVIRVDGKKIAILDANGLKSIAHGEKN
jgi:CRP/FNR family transcriptional regulator